MRMRGWINTTLILVGFTTLLPGFLRSGQAGAHNAGVEDTSFAGEKLSEFRISVDAGMVFVPVTVRRADGSFIKGLQQESFKVLENGEEQKMIFFTEEAVPVHIAMMLDASGSVSSVWKIIQRATARFLGYLSPDDNFSVVMFNSAAWQVMDWGNDADRVYEAMSSVDIKGGTRLWDSIHVVSTSAFNGISGKKVMVLLSDGIDTSSRVSYEEAVRATVENEISIYVTGVSGGDGNTSYSSESVLSRLARDTGGRMFMVKKFDQIDAVYAEIAGELRNQYMLGYTPVNTAKDGSFRKIDVNVSVPDTFTERNVLSRFFSSIFERGASDIRVTARPGYYASKVK